MFNSHDLFKNRFTSYIQETSRYLKYIFNGHIAIAMFFLISAIAVYYQQWLQQLPENFPSTWIIGIIFGLVVSYNPVQTLLQEPDLVFLIPAEHKMNQYFRNTLVFSYIQTIFMSLFIVAAVSPLYFHSFPNRTGSSFLFILIVIVIFKAWNLIANWWMLKIREINVRRIDQLIRIILNCTVFFFIVKGEIALAGITTVLFIGLFLYDYSLSRQQVGLAWDILVEKDQNRMQTFYRIANLFTDVPHLKYPIKKRRWLVSLVSNLPFKQRHTYDYLYRITFMRSGDYLGMYVRLIVVGGLFIYFIPNVWMKILLAFLFIYLSTFQLMTLYHHYRTNMWLDIYPVHPSFRKQAIIKWLFQLTLIQVIIFSIIFLSIQAFVGFITVLVAGTIFNYLFTNGYVKRKLT